MTAETTGPEGKVCPRCAETVKAAARICRYCQFAFDASGTDPRGGTRAAQGAAAAPAGRTIAILLASLGVVALAVLGYILVDNGASSSLSDAERVWCAAGHDSDVTAAAGRLGIDETMIFLAYTYERDGSGIGNVMQSQFDRACKAAFAAR